MGTRGLMGFTSQGEHYLTYNHWDSYPDGLGSQVFGWLDKHLITDEKTGDAVLSVEVLGCLASLEQVEQDGEPDERQLAKLREHGFEKAQAVSTGRDFYAWLRDTQGDLDASLRSGFWIKGGYEFGFDSLFCEWGWVIDADARALDCYQGFQKQPATAGIWAGLPPEERPDGGTAVYHPIQRFWSIPFNWVRDNSVEEFLAECEKRSGNDDD